jgi:hypothetical protein
MSTPSDSVVVVGAGVAACALAAHLRRLGWSGSLTLVEAGRGIGGRAASRRSRRHPGARLDHGAPRFGLAPDHPPALLEPLLAGGRLTSLAAAAPDERLLDEQHRLLTQPGPFSEDGVPHRGTAGMEDLALGLLELAEQARQAAGPAAGAPPLQRVHGRRVQQLLGGGSEPWRLLDSDGIALAQGHWLVLSGTLLAHPRCLPLLGIQELPLDAANRRLRDPRLTHALDAVAALDHDPRLALLFWVGAQQARPWQALPFRHLSLSPSARERWGLERITVQPQPEGAEPGLIGVVAHASPGALRCPATGRATGASATDQETITAFSAALLEVLAPWINAADLPEPQERELMRWGGAFPLPPGLEPEAMVCPDSHLALCGDAIAGPGFGRVSGAWHSGEWLAQRLLPLLGSREA